MTTASSIAKALGNGKEQQNNGGWVTCCPLHGDLKPSLSIKDTVRNGHDDVTVNCFAGCEPLAVKDEIRGMGLLPKLNGKKVPLPKTNMAPLIWNNAQGDTGTFKDYLLSRGINLERDYPSMRAGKYNGQVQIVCAMQDPLDETSPENPVAVHVTIPKDNQKKDTRCRVP